MEEFLKNNIGWLGLGGLGLSSILLGGWRYILTFLDDIKSIVFVTYEIDDYSIHESILLHLHTNFKTIKLGDNIVDRFFYHLEATG